MTNKIRMSIVDNLLADKIEAALKDTNYDILHASGETTPGSDVLITDNLSLLDTPEFQDNLTIPVLYVAPQGTERFDDSFCSEHNIFRAVIPNQDISSFVESPAKIHPVSRKSLGEIVEFLLDAKSTINRFELLLESSQFEAQITHEQHYTQNGDYGRSDDPQEKLSKIRGTPRQISRVEAAYQAIEVFKLFDKPANNIKSRNSIAHKKVFLISPDQERILKYANFLQEMTGAIVEVGNQFHNFTADEIQKENYSLIIYDGTTALSTESGIKDLENLIDHARTNNTEVITICSPTRAVRLLKDVKMRYKAHSILPSANPDYKEFLESVMHTLEVQSGVALASMLDRPSHALVADAIENLLRSDNPEAIARGKNQIQHALAYYARMPIETIADLNVLATDDLFSAANWDLPADESPAGHLKLPDAGYLIKFFLDERRAKCETLALQSLQEHNLKLTVNLKNSKTGSLSKKEDLYWTNMPMINTRKIAKSHGQILISDYIFGPTLEQLALEINTKIKAQDKQATDFRNRVLFAMNQYCALFQVKTDLFPLDGIATEETRFSKDSAHILTSIKTLGISSISAAEYRCAAVCAEIFDINIADPHSTQYSDFYWDNILIETGNDSDSFDDLMEKRRAKGLEMDAFIEEHICRIDFNKIYRLTSMTEDPSRFAVKNFMRAHPRNKSERDKIEEERKYFYKHFLMYRRKFQLLEELIKPDTIYDQFAPEIDELSTWIDRWENRPWVIKAKEEKRINELIGAEMNDFFYTERYVTTYRAARHTILLFNSMKNQKKRLATGRVSEKEFKENVQFIEKDLKTSYNQVARILKTIIDEKKDCIKNKSLDVSPYKQLISQANKNLTAEHATEFRTQLTDIKTVINPEERNALFTYVAANYLHAFFKKVQKSKFNIDYEAL